jgi:predicted PhzF superfamily epimerase YddE/YHI9
MALTVLRVFCAEDGSGGNELGVYLDGSEVPREGRQARAAELGYAETIFVDDRARAAVQIFTPGTELPFAGHPMVGLGWLLGDVDVLRPPAGEVPTWAEGEDRWIRANPEWGPPFELREHASPEEVDALPVEGALVYAWAWIGEGRIRARSFVAEAGVPEDEATGSAAARLVAELDSEIEINQGMGSRILARPGPGGTAEVGGLVVA